MIVERPRQRLVRVERLRLGVALALVSLSDLFLGVDSCMLHMADLCRVPGVGLFGPDSSEGARKCRGGLSFRGASSRHGPREHEPYIFYGSPARAR